MISRPNNQDAAFKRIDSYRKGCQKGQLDIIIANSHKKYSSFAIEFKSRTNNYQISKAQMKMTERYKTIGFKFLFSNDYHWIIAHINY